MYHEGTKAQRLKGFFVASLLRVFVVSSRHSFGMGLSVYIQLPEFPLEWNHLQRSAHV